MTSQSSDNGQRSKGQISENGHNKNKLYVGSKFKVIKIPRLFLNQRVSWKYIYIAFAYLFRF